MLLIQHFPDAPPSFLPQEAPKLDQHCFNKFRHWPYTVCQCYLQMPQANEEVKSRPHPPCQLWGEKESGKPAGQEQSQPSKTLQGGESKRELIHWQEETNIGVIQKGLIYRFLQNRKKKEALWTGMNVQVSSTDFALWGNKETTSWTCTEGPQEGKVGDPFKRRWIFMPGSGGFRGTHPHSNLSSQVRNWWVVLKTLKSMFLTQLSGSFILALSPPLHPHKGPFSTVEHQSRKELTQDGKGSKEWRCADGPWLLSIISQTWRSVNFVTLYFVGKRLPTPPLNSLSSLSLLPTDFLWLIRTNTLNP